MAKNRSLKAVMHRLGRIDEQIQAVIRDKGKADVLEVGCGFGLPMLELMKKFRHRIAITGINRDARFNLPRKALWEGVKQLRFPPWELFTYERRYGYPAYVNCDASKVLPFATDSFDFAYSIATTFFLHDKIHFLQELYRVLRPGMVARIHFSYSAVECGPYRGAPEPPYDNLCEIRGLDGKVLDTEEYLASFDAVSFVQQGSGLPKYLELRKLSEKISFGLKLIDSCWLPEVNKDWIGYARSVYCLDGDRS